MFVRAHSTLVRLSCFSALSVAASGAGLIGCAPGESLGTVAPVSVPNNDHLVLLAPAPISIPNDLLDAGTLYFVDDTTGRIVAVFPYRKGMNLSVSNLTPGRRYRIYRVPPSSPPTTNLQTKNN